MSLEHPLSSSLSAVDPVAPVPTSQSRRRAWQRLRRNRGALLAIAFLSVVLIFAVFQHVLEPYDPNFQPPGLNNLFASPSWQHWLGTDDLGRDIWSRIIAGSGIAMRVSAQVVALAMAVALPIGLVSGYLGGRVDNLIMRVTDAGLSFPPLVLAIAVASILGRGVGNASLAISIVLVPGFVRLVRGSALAVTQETFIEASRSIGTSSPSIVRKRVLPNVRSPLLVAASLSFGGALLAEAALSFLGLGVQAPDASWGNMLREAYTYALFEHPWQLVVPGVAIALTVLAFNTLGDGLRDAYGVAEPRRRRRGAKRGITAVVRVDIAPAAGRRVAGAGPLLAIRDLCVEFDTDAGPLRVVEHVDLEVASGQVVGLVGESGSGKTVTSLSIMRLLASPPGRITGGEICFEGQDLLALSFEQMRRIRGSEIGMVFQDPMTSLNPAYTIGNQLAEAVRLHEDISRKEARQRALEMLELVAIPDPAQRMHEFAHQLSGGMRQRVMIAMALICSPKLLIADEPTTALDVTIQAQILDLLRSLQTERNLGVLLVTHDLGVIADVCDQVAVMYAGQIVEQGSVDDLFERPRHPYTEGLLRAMPQTGKVGETLFVIPGQVPSPSAMPVGCRFHLRCPYAVDACRSDAIELVDVGDGQRSRCIRHDELTLTGAP